MCLLFAPWLSTTIFADDVASNVDQITRVLSPVPSRTVPTQLPPIAIPIRRFNALKDAELRAMDLFYSTYGEEDLSALRTAMVAQPYHSENMNHAMIFISLGSTAFQRYVSSREIVYLERAFVEFEWLVDNSRVWTKRWASGPTAVYLVSQTLRCKKMADRGGLPAQAIARITLLHERAVGILRDEAVQALNDTLPHLPLDSSVTGDSKAEENAWMASTFAWAVALIPTDPFVGLWERKARQLAYNSITRPSDPPDAEGLKVTTVTEDFVLSNHGFSPNPFYVVGTLFLLRSGELGFKMNGRQPFPEFQHNVEELHTLYRSYIKDDFTWRYVADPKADATHFPMWGYMTPQMELDLVRLRIASRALWGIPGTGLPVYQAGQTLDKTNLSLWTAIMRAKVVLYYLHGSYLWQFED